MIPKDNLLLSSHNLAFEIFSTEHRMGEKLKYDESCPTEFFIKKYTGGPLSNVVKRKPVDTKDIIRAAMRIQSMFRVWKAKKKRLELLY